MADRAFHDATSDEEYKASKGIAVPGEEGRRIDIGERVLNGRERKIAERSGSACALGYTEFLRTFPSVGCSTPDREQPAIGGGPRRFVRRATPFRPPSFREDRETRTVNKKGCTVNVSALPRFLLSLPSTNFSTVSSRFWAKFEKENSKAIETRFESRFERFGMKFRKGRGSTGSSLVKGGKDRRALIDHPLKINIPVPR